MVQSNSIKTIVHRYYDAWARQDEKAVRDLIDENLDFLINSNNLTGSEILELPRGREVVYYV